MDVEIIPGKPVSDYTDEELEAMTAEQLDSLGGDGPVVGEKSGDGTGTDPVADDKDDKGDKAGDEEEQEEEEEEEQQDDDAAAEAERLRKLAEEDDGGDMVPRSRFNEVNEREKDTRELLRTVLANRGVPMPGEQQQAPVQEEAAPKRPEYDIKAGMREYSKLMSEGEDEKAAAKLDEVEDARAAQQAFDLEQARADAEAKAVHRITAAQQKVQIEETQAALYKVFPFLNNTNKAADPDAILAVNAKAKALVQQGKSPAAALLEAGESIGKRFAALLKPAKTTGKTEETDTKGERADGKKPAPDTRTAESIRRNLGIRQPGTQKSGVGTRDGVAKLDISKMTDEQIDKLSPEELKEALGYELT